MRSAKAEQSSRGAPNALGAERLLSAGQSYIERLGILYQDEIRLMIVMELYMREMGPRQFFETVGGSSYDSVRRHFLKLVEFGWLRKVRTVATGRGRPETRYRSTEQAVIDTETWSSLPLSIRDAATVVLLEEMGTRVGEALASGLANRRPDQVAVFKVFDVDEWMWGKAYEAVERCFQTLRQEQIDAKIRLETSGDRPSLMIVNLAAFEAPGPQANEGKSLPKPENALPPAPWPQRIGRVFSDRLDLAIIEELNHDTMTPAQLQERLGGTSSQGFLRRCKRLSDLGWVVNINTQTGGALHGASVYHFRAAAPAVSAKNIYEHIPPADRKGPSWETFQQFAATSVAAVDAGTFNRRFDRHLTMSPLLVDEIGWQQVTKALTIFEKALLWLHDQASGRTVSKRKTFKAALLASSFQAPIRKKT